MAREWDESSEERAELHRQTRRRHFTSVIVAMLMVAILGLLAYTGARGVVEETRQTIIAEAPEYQVKAEIIDESGQGQISGRMREYIGQVEQDLAELGYTVVRVALPVNTSREILVSLEGVKPYIKMTIDRGAGVSAEDTERMLKYLAGQGIEAEYIDVRVEGKGYYK